MTDKDLGALLRAHVQADEPPTPPPNRAIALGHTRIRRRRTWLIAGAAAAAVVVAVALGTAVPHLLSTSTQPASTVGPSTPPPTPSTTVPTLLPPQPSDGVCTQNQLTTSLITISPGMNQLVFYIGITNTGAQACNLPRTTPTGFSLSNPGAAPRHVQVSTMAAETYDLAPLDHLAAGQTGTFTLHTTDGQGACESPGPVYHVMSFHLGSEIHLTLDLRHTEAGAIEVACELPGVSAVGLMPDQQDSAGIPATVDDLPQGPAPTIPYVLAGTLYVDGKPVASHVSGVVAAGSTVLAIHIARPLHRRGTTTLDVDQVADGHQTPVPALHAIGRRSSVPFGPTLSPNGRFAAQALAGRTTTRYSEWSFTEHRLVGTIDLPSNEFTSIIGVDDAGRVYLTESKSGQGLPTVWIPGHVPQPLPRADVTAANTGRLTIGPDGPKIVLAAGAGGAVSSDDTESAYNTMDWQSADVVHLATIESVRLDAPAPVVRIVAFESDASVLVVSGRVADRWLLRCSTTTGACERVLKAPPRDHLAFTPVTGVYYE